MVRPIEFTHRIQKFLRFDRQELGSLGVAIFVTGFIFSFRDWGDTTFSVSLGLQHLLLVLIAVGITFFFRTTCQKLYALSVGYKADFKVWWVGLVIALIIAFITKGFVSIIIIGTVVTAFMVKQRIGEFRYGLSFEENALTAVWGIYGNLILALLFSVGALYFPESYFFTKAVTINLVMALCSLIPLPQLDGLTIIWGSKTYYIIGSVTSLLAPLLLVSYKINLMPQKIGLIVGIIIGTVAGGIYLLISSEK